MRFDVIIAGGGLAGGLIAYRLAHKRPELRVALVDAGASFGGNHTWSFFETDLTPSQRDWLEPFIVYRWQGYEVRFPAHRRQLTTRYQSVTDTRFHEVLERALPRAGQFAGRRVATLGPTHLQLEDGAELHAPLVIDARGGATNGHNPLSLAWQKFVGLEVEVAGGHGLERPIVMDATVPQIDGYRFVYCLPFSPNRLLIEDTYYADGNALPLEAIEARIGEYAEAQGWRIVSIVRRENGVLPIALGGEVSRLHQEKDVPQAGMRGGLFHPLTGYSLPDAAKAADLVASLATLTSANVHDSLAELAERLWQQRRFHRLLARLLFQAAVPERRYKVMERFYRLPEPLVERLYAGKSTARDRARILVGKPPVPFFKAVGVVVGGEP